MERASSEYNFQPWKSATSDTFEKFWGVFILFEGKKVKLYIISFIYYVQGQFIGFFYFFFILHDSGLETVLMISPIKI